MGIRFHTFIHSFWGDTMKIQYTSDLHTEFGARPFRKSDIKGDVLVLAGDIAGKPRKLNQYLHSLAGSVPILYVMGNHEFYGHDFAMDFWRYQKTIETQSGVHFLENRSVEIAGIRFLGCTLWTDFFGGMQGKSSERGINDFEFITLEGDKLHWMDVAYRHRGSLAWLRKELETFFPGSTVVITHHAPSALSNPPQFAGSPISGAFYSILDDLIEETQPALWIHGHMHNTSDYLIGKTRVVCNPFGYEGIEVNVDWDPEAMVVV